MKTTVNCDDEAETHYSPKPNTAFAFAVDWANTHLSDGERKLAAQRMHKRLGKLARSCRISEVDREDICQDIGVKLIHRAKEHLSFVRRSGALQALDALGTDLSFSPYAISTDSYVRKMIRSHWIDRSNEARKMDSFPDDSFDLGHHPAEEFCRQEREHEGKFDIILDDALNQVVEDAPASYRAKKREAISDIRELIRGGKDCRALVCRELVLDGGQFGRSLSSSRAKSSLLFMSITAKLRVVPGSRRAALLTQLWRAISEYLPHCALDTLTFLTDLDTVDPELLGHFTELEASLGSYEEAASQAFASDEGKKKADVHYSRRYMCQKSILKRGQAIRVMWQDSIGEFREMIQRSLQRK